MTINGDSSDTEPVIIRGDALTVNHCDLYVYLGSIFTCDGKVNTAIKEHAKSVKKHLLKLTVFFKRNTDMPFIVKKKALDAAFISAILYGCETWLGACFRDMEKLYHGAIKSLLGVRTTGSNDFDRERIPPYEIFYYA